MWATIEATSGKTAEAFEFLKHLSRAVSGGATVDGLLDFIYEHARTHLPYNRIGYAAVEAESGRVVARWARSDRRACLRLGFAAPLEGSSLAGVLETGKPRILNDLAAYLREHPRSLSTRLIVKEGMRSSLTCPLSVRGKHIGFLFFSSTDVGAYRPEHVTFIEQIASQVSTQLLVAREQQLLQKTLSGVICLLTDVLSLTHPVAFGRTQRVGRLVKEMCQHLQVANRWQIEIAAMLSQVGRIARPDGNTVPAAQGGVPDEYHLPEPAAGHGDHTALAAEWIRRIPRLEPVAEIVKNQNARYPATAAALQPALIPLGARMLKVALDYDELLNGGANRRDALAEMRRRAGWYDPHILEALAQTTADADSRETEVPLTELSDGMVLAEDIATEAGRVLISAGHEVNSRMRRRLLRFAEMNDRVREPIRVFKRRESVATIS